MRRLLVFAWGLLASMIAVTSTDASAFSPRLEDRLIRVKASDAQIIPLRLWGKQDAPSAIILCILGLATTQGALDICLRRSTQPTRA